MKSLKVIICILASAFILSTSIAVAGGGHNVRACILEPDLPFCD